MGNLLLGTNAVNGSEPCFGLSEQNVVTLQAGVGVRRMQIIQVVRNDRIAEFRRDLGPASAFKTEEFAFPGAIPLGNGRWEVLETVERLEAAANEFRAKYDKPHERQEPEDFKEQFEAYASRRRDARAGRKRFAVRGAK